MTVLSEYMKKINLEHWGYNEFEKELKRLIKLYNSKRNTYMFLYVSSFNPNLPSSLEQKDYYFIKDLIEKNETNTSQNLDIYIETPGGSGTTAEEIVKLTRKNYDKVSFVICGEAKSAGTIMAMSGDEILMTQTGSLGPIDAQIVMHGNVVSAYDYIDWMNQKKKEAEKTGTLNPADVVILSQITPGELNGVINSLKFAEDLVKKWLNDYKFKNWETTETTHKPVTDRMRKSRATSIAKKLSNHNFWRTHGRSLKLEDLEELGLRIVDLDDENNKDIGEIVYKINMVCRMMLNMSNSYKIVCTSDQIISFNAQPNTQSNVQQVIPDNIHNVELDQECPNCGKVHKLYAKLINNKQIDAEMSKKGRIPFPIDNELKCECGFNINLQGVRSQIESQFKKKIC